MAKLKQKTFEKKSKPATEFDKKTPEQRIKTIKEGKVTKKSKEIKKDVLKTAILLDSKDPEKKILKKVKKSSESKEEKAPILKAEDLVKKDLVKLGIANLRKGVSNEIEDNSKTAKNLFDDELRYGLNVIAVKIPNGPPHTRKILLKNSLYDEKPDVCFFIGDSIPKKADQEEAVRNFKEKLQAAEITNVTQVMTLGQLKRDYTTHNLKLKLCHTYDVFLVESRIAEHIYSILGKHFIKKRKRPFQIDTKSDKNMKISIDNTLKKSVMKISPKSLISSFEIGISKMDDKKMVENVMSAIEQLQEKWPGGWKNVARIYLRPMQPSKVSIPIYASALNPNEVEVPVIVGSKQKRLAKLESKMKKKSDKLKVDPKTKKVVNARHGLKLVKAVDATSKVENKKRKLEGDDQKASPKKAKKVKKTKPAVEKKEKSDETQQAVTVATKLGKKKKNKKLEVPVEVVAVEPTEVVKEKKNKKKKAEITQETEPIVKDKKKKMKKAVEEIEEVPVLVKADKKKKKPQPAVDTTPEQATKPKNKKKSTAVTDVINSHDEKDQAAAKSNKKKAKKNKA